MTDLIYSAGFFGWLGEKVIDGIASFFFSILLTLNAIIYSFISYIYNIFLILAGGGRIFDDTQIGDMVSRIYVIIGVIVLFLVAYSLLKSMVNPDEAFKGKKSPVNIIKDVLISIVLISIVPYIFDFAFEFQNSLLINNTIGKIIAGSATGGNEDTIRMGGYKMAEGVWQAFIHPADGMCATEVEEINKVKEVTGEPCEVIYLSDGTSYATMWKNAEDSTTFWEMAGLAKPIIDDKVTYLFFFDIVTGIFVLFVMISYCLDMALRLVKLAVYELIAPLPILARIIPHEQAGKIFSNWLKATLSTFAEVFIRIAILYFAVIIIATVGSSLDNLFLDGAFATEGALPFTRLIAQMLIIVGIVLFVKQAPEIIKEITGLDGSKYNVLKSAKQGFSLIAGGVVGGLAGASRNPLSRIADGVRAWEGAGKAKSLTDFSSIGNQFRRRQLQKEAKEQGASGRDRMGDRVRKAFGFETKLEQANRNLERGLDMNGNVQRLKNDTEDAIYSYVTDANGKFIYEDARDEHGNIIYEKDEAGNYKLDASGNKIAKKQKKKEKIIGKNAPFDMTEEMMTKLQNQKDQLAIYMSQIDEQIRQVKDGQKVDQQYIDLRGKIKKKALEKINEGHNHIKQHLVLEDGTDLGEMNYAAMKAYEESRVAAGATAEELQMIKTAVMKAEDEMWVKYANWAIQDDVGGEISTWYDQAVQYHDKVGIYDAKTKKMFKYDAADLNSQMEKVVDTYIDKATGATKDLKDHMAIFESKGIKLVNATDGSAYTDESGVQLTSRGFDKTAKKQANDAETIVQGMEIDKVEFDDNSKRIERLTKQLEERKTTEKSSPRYQAYKASDNANKINDSGKSGS